MSTVKIIKAIYSINTPMFLGSACIKEAELRPPSVIGILRFWFRALALGELGGDKRGVFEYESILFGTAGTGDESGGRKALYSLKIKKNNLCPKKELNFRNKHGLTYLAYGLNKYNKKEKIFFPTRNFLPQNNNIEIILIENRSIKANLDSEKVKKAHELLIKTLKLMGFIGGLGSRTRRGFGSLTLIKLEEDGKMITTSGVGKTALEYKKELKELLSKSLSFNKNYSEIEYTAISQNTKIHITNQKTDPLDVINEIGEEMIRYRSYGRNGKILNKEGSRKIFKDDHDLIYNFVKGTNINEHPRRVVFGLPHNYRLGGGQNININSKNRRASPLFIHIHKLKNSKYIGVLVLIPCKFLKNGDKITLRGRNRKGRSFSEKASYKIIEDFLNESYDNKI